MELGCVAAAGVGVVPLVGTKAGLDGGCGEQEREGEGWGPFLYPPPRRIRWLAGCAGLRWNTLDWPKRWGRLHAHARYADM